MKNLLFTLCFFVSTAAIFAENSKTENEDETAELKSIVSFDPFFTIAALRHTGMGISINYERKLTGFLSIKPGLGYMACFSDPLVMTVNLRLFFYYYPLSNGLDKLYVGLGSGTDFMMYPGEDDMQNDMIISITPVLGWKWRALKWLILDALIGWKFYALETNNYEDISSYFHDGFQWGLGFKIFLPN